LLSFWENAISLLVGYRGEDDPRGERASRGKHKRAAGQGEHAGPGGKGRWRFTSGKREGSYSA